MRGERGLVETGFLEDEAQFGGGLENELAVAPAGVRPEFGPLANHCRSVWQRPRVTFRWRGSPAEYAAGCSRRLYALAARAWPRFGTLLIVFRMRETIW